MARCTRLHTYKKRVTWVTTTITTNTRIILPAADTTLLVRTTWLNFIYMFVFRALIDECVVSVPVAPRVVLLIQFGGKFITYEAFRGRLTGRCGTDKWFVVSGRVD
ncbi:hypothetical protein ZHAS_00014357 [Anopheles sinensis]|uniref:Uncharacterized protein n=1 Tax=Anopheles sinensis TaxID=74873 RepID=A0A084W822_ANOSI|nr:hypothetical protein ZHAS_00014357 [Anopheles sinensis]